MSTPTNWIPMPSFSFDQRTIAGSVKICSEVGNVSSTVSDVPISSRW
jgi:hypothetical protein